MPNSQPRRKVTLRRSTEHDRLLRAEARRAAGPRSLKQRLGWALCAAGVLLFLVGYVTSAAGVQVIPFDRHHLISQIGGFALASLGLGRATR